MVLSEQGESSEQPACVSGSFRSVSDFGGVHAEVQRHCRVLVQEERHRAQSHERPVPSGPVCHGTGEWTYGLVHQPSSVGVRVEFCDGTSHCHSNVKALSSTGQMTMLQSIHKTQIQYYSDVDLKQKKCYARLNIYIYNVCTWYHLQ